MPQRRRSVYENSRYARQGPGTADAVLPVMFTLLALVSAALAVPKVFSDTVELLAVAPDGHRVLLGTLGSFDDLPHDLVEKDVATGKTRAVGPGLQAAFASCGFASTCAALDDSWIPGAWVAYRQPRATAKWAVATRAEDGWDTQLAGSCADDALWACRGSRGADTVELRVEGRQVEISLSVDQRQRTVQLSPDGLRKLGQVDDPWAGVVVWGTDGVLLALPGEWADEGAAQEPPMAFVLPTR